MSSPKKRQRHSAAVKSSRMPASDSARTSDNLARSGSTIPGRLAVADDGGERWVAWLPDLGCLALLWIYWGAAIGPLVIAERLQAYDVNRDIASAVNFQAGLFLADPTTRGETMWYPPLSPLLAAGLSWLLGITPADCYRWSQLLVNWMLPAGMFLTVRLAWGRRVGLIAMVAMLLAMPWWQVNTHMGMASWQALIGGWVALLLYAAAQQTRSWRWGLACGLWQGGAFLHHPLVPLVLSAAFGLLAIHELAGLWRRKASAEEWRASLRLHALIAGVALLIGLPVVYWLQHGPTLNPMPRQFFSADLRTVRFALLGGNPWLWGTGLLGLVVVQRRGGLSARLLLSMLLVCLAGQLSAYGRVFGPAWASFLPVVLPHQFQAYSQLCWAACMGVGIDALLRFIASRVAAPAYRTVLEGVLLLVALGVTAGPGLLQLDQLLHRHQHNYERPGEFVEAAGWIRTHTRITDVFVTDYQLAFTWLNPQTGRKVWLAPVGHTNPRVDWQARARVYSELLRERSPERFARLLRERGIDYCLVAPEWIPASIGAVWQENAALPDGLVPVFQRGAVLILRVEAAGS
jgi:hypothetical protein